MGHAAERFQFFVFAIAAALWLTSPIACAGDLEKGEALVRTNCMPCHAIGRIGDSPHPDAPPFRRLSQRYPVESLAEALAEGISTGHPDMPEFVGTPDQIEEIIAYLESIQPE